jgi:hypothetical protein
MSQAPSVERRLILTLLVIAGIAIAGVLAILRLTAWRSGAA